MWKFPELQRPTVFIGAPGDVKYLRTAAISEIHRIKAKAAAAIDIAVYDWMVDKSEDGFDDWIPAQNQIPLPTDPNCRAVICALGARIGTPLPEMFPLDAIGRHARSRSRRGYGALVPWADAGLEGQSFSMTGTVFEYLAVLEASQQGAGHVPPVLLLFVGDESIRDDTDHLDANWGGGRLYQEAQRRFKTSELRRWETQHYIPQVVQLRNFLRYVEDQGIVPKIVPDEASARREIRKFLAKSLGVRLRSDDLDPFKGLESYDVDDAEVLYGREQERRDAAVELQTVWADPGRPNSLCVLGGSGAGKSSFLKAGLFADLKSSAIGGDYAGFVVEPKDLAVDTSPGADSVPPALATLVARTLKSLDENSDVEGAIQTIAEAREDLRPAKAVELIVDRLERKGPDWRLLIGIDQFEVLVDQWLEEKSGTVWKPVVDFILLASRSPKAAVLYTLQLNRAERVAADPHLGPFWTGGGTQLLGFPRQSLRTIIENPFELKGIRLEANLARELEARVIAFAERGDPQTQGSLLPLVSLTLRRLFLARGANLLRKALQQESSDREPVLLLEDCKGYLDIETAIAEQAKQALRETRQETGPAWSDDTIGNLFRRLVRIRGADRDLLDLPIAKIPTHSAERALAESLAKRRLVLHERHGRIRLVHEAVLRHWPAARSWLDEERVHLERTAALAADAREWQARSFEEEFLKTAGQREVDRAAAVLSTLAGVLADRSGRKGSKPDELLRRYCLALLAHHPDPVRLIESSRNDARHVHIAAAYGATDLVRQYIAKDSDCMHAKNKFGQTPLFSPCYYGHAEAVELLLEAGADAEVLDEHGWHPLHYAASTGQHAVVERLLLEESVEPDVCDRNGYSALHAACRGGHTAVIESLLATGRVDLARKDHQGWNPLHYAVYGGNADAVSILLSDPRVDPYAVTSRGGTAVDIALGSAEVLRVLLAAGVDPKKFPSKAETTPLHRAASEGRSDVAEMLIAAGLRTDLRQRDGKSVTETALAHRHFAFVEMLVSHGADLDMAVEDGQTALHKVSMGWASVDENYGVVDIAGELARFLLAKGARVVATDATGRTPLHVAAQYGSEEVAEILIGGGAPIDAVTADGATALHLAARSGSGDVVKQLLRRGAAPDPRDAAGWTPLHEAAQEGRADIASRLIERGCEVDAVAVNPQLTPLATAAETGMSEVIELLLQHGADASATVRQLSEPLLLAIKNTQYEAARRLLVHRMKARSPGAPWIEAAGRLFRANRLRREAAGVPASSAESAFADRLRAAVLAL